MVVYVDISSELMYDGDVSVLRAAQDFAHRMNMPLLVSGYSYEKSCTHTPIFTLHECVAIVKACGYTDEVLNALPIITKEFMAKYNIQMVVHTTESNESYRVPAEMGRFQKLICNKFVR